MWLKMLLNVKMPKLRTFSLDMLLYAWAYGFSSVVNLVTVIFRDYLEVIFHDYLEVK